MEDREIGKYRLSNDEDRGANQFGASAYIQLANDEKLELPGDVAARESLAKIRTRIKELKDT